MIHSLFVVLLLIGCYPWVRAWLAMRHTSLGHTLVWALVAWLSWWPVLCDGHAALHYIALCLTACAGVAVLGARRPGVAAWNLVVAGLFVVMVLPVLENQVRDSQPLGPVRLVFLIGTLLVVIGNYLPTRLGPAAALCACAVAGEILFLCNWPNTVVWPVYNLALLMVPWVGWACLAWPRQGASELARRWLDFRDRHGALWSLRVRDQFNHAAEHAGWPGRLTWNGVADPDAAPTAEMLAGLQAVLKRFGA